MKLIERQALIIWLYSTKNIKKLRKHGYIYYISRRMKYAVMYVNKNEAEEIKKEISAYFFVREVEFSYRDDIDMTFKNAIDYQEDVPTVEELPVSDVEEELVKAISESIRSKNKMK